MLYYFTDISTTLMRRFSITRGIGGMLIVITAILLSACGSNSDGPEDPTHEDEGICVSIALCGQGSGDTRAAGEDSEDTDGEFGTIADNYINKDDLYIMTFSIEEKNPDGSDNVLKVLTSNSRILEVLWSPATANITTDASWISSNGETVYLTTKLSSNIIEYNNDKDFCIVAIANPKSFTHLSSAPAFSPISGMTFEAMQKAARYVYGTSSSSWSWKPDNTKKTGIPMFGVKRVNLKGYNPQVHNEANPYPLTSGNSTPLWLLRSFAKLSIVLSDELKNLTINGTPADVRLTGGNIGNGYASDFWLIPDPNRMKSFTTTGGTGYISKEPNFSTHSSIDAPMDCSLNFNISANGDIAYLYLPEYLLLGKDIDIEISISVEGSPQTYSFKFKQYPTDGETESNEIMWNYVLRNYSYKFAVTLDFRLITVKPDDWGDAFDNEFNFG